MTKGEWLPLLNYSTKHGVSLSTLRRRIKAATIEFKLESGKYFILDDKPQAPSPAVTRALPEPIPQSFAMTDLTPRVTPKITIAPVTNQYRSAIHPSLQESSLTASSFVEASVLTSANRLVEEIKSAYAKILQEKEEQIAQLKEEVVDLRMLVRILEDGQAAATSRSNAAEASIASSPASRSTSANNAHGAGIDPYLPDAERLGSLNEAAALQKFHEQTLEANAGSNEEFFFSDFQTRDI